MIHDVAPDTPLNIGNQKYMSIEDSYTSKGKDFLINFLMEAKFVMSIENEHGVILAAVPLKTPLAG